MFTVGLHLPKYFRNLIYVCGRCEVNALRPRENSCHFASDTFKRIFMNEKSIFSTQISLMFVPVGPVNNISALVQILAWHRPDKSHYLGQ